MNRIVWAICFAAIVFSGCNFKLNPFRRKDKANTVKEQKTTSSAKLDKEKAVILKKTQQKQATYQSFSGKAKLNATVSGSSLSLSANIRIKSGSVIWMSITAIAGIEVARVLITPDSIKLLDRINNKYIKEDFRYLHTLVSSEVNFETLESILVGTIPSTYLMGNLAVNKDTVGYILQGASTGMDYSFATNAKQQLLRSVFSDRVYNQSLNVSYNDISEIDKQDFPTVINIFSVVGQEKTEAKFTYAKIEINKELEFPFNVPRKFDEK